MRVISRNLLPGVDLLAWASVTLEDSSGIADPITYYLTGNDPNDPQGDGPDPMAKALNGENYEAANPQGSMYDHAYEANEAATLDSRWIWTHGLITVNKADPTQLLLGDWTDDPAFPKSQWDTVEQNLGANLAAFGMTNDDLTDEVLNGTKYDIMRIEIRMSRLDNGYEQAFIEGAEGDQVIIPEPTSIVVWSLLTVAGLGLGFWRRQR